MQCKMNFNSIYRLSSLEKSLCKVSIGSKISQIWLLHNSVFWGLESIHQHMEQWCWCGCFVDIRGWSIKWKMWAMTEMRRRTWTLCQITKFTSSRMNFSSSKSYTLTGTMFLHLRTRGKPRAHCTWGISSCCVMCMCIYVHIYS